MMHHHDYQNISPASVVDEVKHGCLSLLSKPLPPVPQIIASSDFASTTRSGGITNSSKQQEIATGNSSRKCVRFQLPPDTESSSSSSEARDDSLPPPPAGTKSQEQEGRDETPSAAVWYTRNEMQEFRHTSRRHVDRFFQVSQNQEWINQFCDDLCFYPPSERPLTFKQMLIKHPTPIISSSEGEDGEEYIPRGLLLRVCPTIQGHRKRHMKRLLLIQHKLMRTHEKNSRKIDVFGPSASSTTATTRQSILRLTSKQSSRPSKIMARWLAYHDCMDVMCMVKKELK